MAFVKVAADGPVVRLYPDTDKTHKHKVGINLAAWTMIGYPVALDVLYDADSHKLALRNGRGGGTFLLASECDKFAFHVAAEEVYDAAGIDLLEKADFTPQLFTWGEDEEPDPEVASAVWIQLP